MAGRERVGEIFKDPEGITSLQWVVSDVQDSIPTEYASDSHTLTIHGQNENWSIVTHAGYYVRFTRADLRRGRVMSFKSPSKAMAHAEKMPVDANHMARYGGGLPEHVKAHLHAGDDNQAPAP